MRFSKKEEVAELIDLILSEQRELSALHKRFEAAKSVWFRQQRAVCEIESLRSGHESTYTRAAEPFFRDYADSLSQERDAAIAKRDALIGDLPQEIRAVQDRIHRRLSILTGCLSAFTSAVVGHNRNGSTTSQCAPHLIAELQAARKQAEELTDPAALITLIKEIVEKVESANELQAVPLLRLDLSVKRALAVGTESA